MQHLDFLKNKTLRQLSKRTLTLSLACILAFSPSMVSRAQDNTKVETVVSKETNSYEQTKKIAKKAANSLIMQSGCASVQYALIHKGEIVLSDSVGFADKEKKKVPTKDTMYGIGSISKVFTTVAIMQLVEKGVLELDKPVVNYIPEFKMADERYKDITVRMLVNHSSGLMGNLLGNTILFYDPDSVNTDSFLKYLSTQRLKADPGSYSVYSNDGFTLAEILIQHVTNTSYTEYVNENICKPLEMTNTKTPESGFPRTQLANTYAGNKSLPKEYANFIGAGGLYSTAEDLCQFLTLFMKDTSILSKKSINEMAQPEYKKGLWGNDGDNIINYGLGWDSINLYPFTRYNMQAFSKGGDTYYYHGSVIMLPDSEYGVAVLSSGGSSSYDQLLGNTILLNALKEQGTISEILPDAKNEEATKVTMPETYKQYDGYYMSNSLVIKVEVTDKDTINVFFDVNAKEGIECEYIGNGIFRAKSTGMNFSFKTLKNNKTYLNIKVYTSVPGLVGNVTDILFAQKAEENVVSDTVQAAWNARLGKKYYVLNEKYSSAGYRNAPFYSFPKEQTIPGYINNNTIVDATHLQQQIQIPIDSGRDLTDYTITTKDGYEYLHANSYVCIEEKAIKKLSSNKKFNVKIASDGYAKIYKLPSKEKKVKLTIPQRASVAIYDKDGNKTFLSTIDEERTVKLPKNGIIYFIADPDTTISVQYK